MKLFKSTDSGAPTLDGQAGSLLNVLNSCLIVNKVFTTADDASFTDRTTEAQLRGGTAFNLLPTGVSGDRIYIGMTTKFGKCRFDLDTVGIGGTYVFEYWNGSAWTALTVVNGTSGFTADGQVTWTEPGSWATNAVNSVTQYWIRVRASAAPSTVPTVNCLSVTDWQREFDGTAGAVYRANTGNRLYLNVNDNGPGAGTTQEARVVGYETMTAFATGTNLFPTAAQQATQLFVRKSAAANGTARAWKVAADHRTFYFQCVSGDTASMYYGMAFGEVYSYLSGSDSWNTILIARSTENNTGGTVENLDAVSGGVSAFSTAQNGHYIARRSAGTGGSLNCDKYPLLGVFLVGAGSGFDAPSGLSYPNESDGGLYLSPVIVGFDNIGTKIRGHMRGMWWAAHPKASFADGDTVSGTGALAGKSFEVVKGGPGLTASTLTSCIFYEVSDTVDVN